MFRPSAAAVLATLSLSPFTESMGQARTSAALSSLPSMTATPVSNTAVRLTWSPAATQPVQILRAIDPNGPFVTVGTVDAGATGFVDGGLIPDLPFYYRVQPSTTTSLRSSAVTATSQVTSIPLATSTTIPIPAGPSVSGRCPAGQCDLNWSPVAGANGYRIQGRWLYGITCIWADESGGYSTTTSFVGRIELGNCGSGLIIRAVFVLRDFPSAGSSVLRYSQQSNVF